MTKPRKRATDELPRRWLTREIPVRLQYLLSAAVVSAVTLVAFPFAKVVGPHPAALIFLLTVAVLALFVGRGPTVLAAAMSVVLWDYFILPPAFAFRIYSFEDAMVLGTYIVVVFVLGELTARTRAQEKAREQGEQRATEMYLLARDLSSAANLDQMLQRVVAQLARAFHARVVVLLSRQPHRLALLPHPASTYKMDESEQAIAIRVFDYGQPAGRFTRTLPQAPAMYVPLMTGNGMVGVLGLAFEQAGPPTYQQQNQLSSFMRQIALALDRHRLQEQSEKAKVLAESERLSKILLRSISHEIRTPLAAIKTAAGNLVELNEPELSGPQVAMIGEIQEAAERLNRLVGKVLDMSRLESGHVKSKPTLCDVNDLIHMALKETRKELARHKLTTQIAPELPLVAMDFVLMQQALMNLLANAAIHTPAGTQVEVDARVAGGVLILAVADDGPGIPPESLTRIFDKFYRGANAPTGGTGLGLSLVKGFVEAQGGFVEARNRTGGGSTFIIRLPLNKIPQEPILAGT